MHGLRLNLARGTDDLTEKARVAAQLDDQTLRKCPQSLQRQLNSSTEGFQK